MQQTNPRKNHRQTTWGCRLSYGQKRKKRILSCQTSNLFFEPTKKNSENNNQKAKHTKKQQKHYNTTILKNTKNQRLLSSHLSFFHELRQRGSCLAGRQPPRQGETEWQGVLGSWRRKTAEKLGKKKENYRNAAYLVFTTFAFHSKSAF